MLCPRAGFVNLLALAEAAESARIRLMEQKRKCLKWFGTQSGAWWTCGGLAVVVTIALVGVQDWGINKTGEVSSDAIRTLVFALGGVGALLGVWLAAIRGKDFTRQVDEQTRQINWQKEQGRAEVFSRCIEQLGDKESVGTHIAGIRILEILARSNQNDAPFLEAICGVLWDFVNKHAPSRESSHLFKRLREMKVPPSFLLLPSQQELQTIQDETGLEKEGAKELMKWHESWHTHKEEVELAIRVFAFISATGTQISSSFNLSYRYLPGLQAWNKEGDQANLCRLDLFMSFLFGANFADANLERVNLIDANLARAHLIGTNLEETKLVHTNLRKATLEKANLRGADLSDANLKMANLEGAHLERADLSRVNFTEAFLVKAHLEGAMLQGAGLEEARLGYANLEGAQLNEVHSLERARFFETILKDTDFDGAHLMGAVYYENENDCMQEGGFSADSFAVYEDGGEMVTVPPGIPLRLGKSVTQEWLRDQGAKNWQTAIESEDDIR